MFLYDFLHKPQSHGFKLMKSTHMFHTYLQLRVSGVISNSPYILGLDCDMYCNDPSSAKQAMCFHLDPKISATLGFVQFPQRFHNVGEHDIYDGHLRCAYRVRQLTRYNIRLSC